MSNFFTEEPFWSILHNVNGVVLPLITELDEPFIRVDISFKLSVEKLIPIRDLLPLKTTLILNQRSVCSYELLISSDTTSWSELEDVDKLVAKQ